MPLLDKLGAAKPCTREVSHVPAALCVKIPKKTPFDTNCLLVPGGMA